MATAREFLPLEGVEPEEGLDPFLEATLEFERVAHWLDLEESVLQRLKHTERELTVHLPLVRDTGEVNTYTGFRVQHSSVRGPTLGGLRFAPDIPLSQAKALAMEQTWQCALLDLPFGGSAGAVVCDPSKLSERELRELTRGYAFALRDVLGPERDIVRPDSGSNEQTMAWALDSLAETSGRLEPSGVTSKPAALWGGLPPAAVIARGAVFLVEQVLAEQTRFLRGQRVAIQGFGQVGLTAARLLQEAGARIVAVADISGGLYDDKGLDVTPLEAHRRRSGVLFGSPAGEPVTNTEVLEAPCDILLLAAAPRQLTATNARLVQASLILEVAPAAVIRRAEAALAERRCVVIPDILANGGDAIAAFLEWLASARYSRTSPGEADQCLRTRLEQAWQVTRAVSKERSACLRVAAHLVAIERVAATLRLK